MISLHNVSRWYGQIIGLNDVTCDIGPGVTALLGMNGAGKSTMLRLITGQLRPTTGDLRVFGLDPFANPEVYKRLGYCPEIDNFYEHRTGRQFVYMLGRYAGFGSKEARERTEQVLELVGMKDRADKKIAGYSKGMRQRIKLAQAMIHDPEIILLDEPLNGLDPVGRREYMGLLHNLALQGKTILVSSHILFEVEQMTSSILLLNRGRLLATGDLRVIRELIDKHPHKIRLQTSEPRRWAEKIVAMPFVLSVQVDRDGLELQTREPNSFYDSLVPLTVKEGLPLTGFSSPDNNLESIFRYLVND
ncbi:MAG: type transport system ATP-binding protein [Fimbriimonadaceae bacterium]|jgi:ABC-2 type transport system ATP-binding protein|nr:type transport system ATP-binding protein [Fimbriimonadaceae bacterium]